MNARAYTPSRDTVAGLERRTVGRTGPLDRIARTLQSAATSANRSHVLLVGPRGHGKSHVVELTLGRIAADPVLQSRLVVAQVPEDAIGVTRFEDLLGFALRALGLPASARGESSTTRQERISTALNGRALVLVIENLDRVMGAIGPGGQRAFRSWVEGSGDVLVLATTPALFAGVRDRDQPWYNAFDVVRLKNLTPREGQELLEHLAETRSGDTEMLEFLRSETGRRRIRALAELTGGSPRIWMLLAECLSPETLEGLIPAVESLLERLTPYYQQLLWELPPQSQRIVRALAEGSSSTMTVAEITEVAEVTGTSTLLSRLERDHWIERVASAASDKRRAWYRLRDPLLRHQFQYRCGDREPLALIVTMLKLTFDPDIRREHLLTVALQQALEDGAGTGHPLVDQLIESRAGSQEASTRLPAELRVVLDRLERTETG